MSALVLASSSTARAQLLRSAGVTFDVASPRLDEEAVKQSLLAEGVDASGVAAALAAAKAVQVSRSHSEALVLGADQVLDFDGTALSKAKDEDEARGQLMRLRGREHLLITSAALARNGAVVWRHASRAKLWMRDFGDEFLNDYLAREADHILWCVGGYRLEGLGAQLFERIEGDYFSILGLPLLSVLSALREQGVLPR
jgi:septum formation protein